MQCYKYISQARHETSGEQKRKKGKKKEKKVFFIYTALETLLGISCDFRVPSPPPGFENFPQGYNMMTRASSYAYVVVGQAIGLLTSFAGLPASFAGEVCWVAGEFCWRGLLSCRRVLLARFIELPASFAGEVCWVAGDPCSKPLGW